MPSAKCFSESFLLLNETAVSSVRGTWRRTHDSSLVWKSEPVCKRASADVCKDALIRCGKNQSQALGKQSIKKVNFSHIQTKQEADYFQRICLGYFFFSLVPNPCRSPATLNRRAENYRTHTLTMQAFFTNTQMQAETLAGKKHTCARAQQLLIGWRPHSQTQTCR